jgi:hypothetical protein
MIFNFGYLGTNKKQSADPDPSCHKYPIPDDTPLPFGHRKIMPDQAAQVAVRRWSAADPPVPLGPLLRRALQQLATACSGMPAGG